MKPQVFGVVLVLTATAIAWSGYCFRKGAESVSAPIQLESVDLSKAEWRANETLTGCMAVARCCDLMASLCLSSAMARTIQFQDASLAIYRSKYDAGSSALHGFFPPALLKEPPTAPAAQTLKDQSGK